MSQSRRPIRFHSSTSCFQDITADDSDGLYVASLQALGRIPDEHRYLVAQFLACMSNKTAGHFCVIYGGAPEPTEPPTPTVPHHVYLVQAGANGPIKIGFSKDPQRRLTELQANQAPPLRLLATLPGGREEEARLHRLFAEHRHEGTEWFAPVPALLALAGGAA